jgi:hypothetical protein
MGTNYYARIIPSVESKNELKNAINNNDYSSIEVLTNELYSALHFDGDKFIGGEVHLGKRSGGWKFLWNPNVYVKRDIYKDESTNEYVLGKYVCKFLYPLTKEGIKQFIDRDDVEIYDEYGEPQDKNEFFKMAIDWVTWKDKEAWDSKTYYEDNPQDYCGYVCNNNLTKYLEQESIDFISDSHSDFYSCGLRFATNTEFS